MRHHVPRDITGAIADFFWCDRCISLLVKIIPWGALLLCGTWVNQVPMGSRPIWPTSGFRLGSPTLHHLHFRPCYSSYLLLCVSPAIFRPTCTALPPMLLRPRKS